MHKPSDGNKPHVVIVGAGFGGLSAAKALKNAPVRVTVIDRTNHHLFQPLLYQVAMAGLSPAEIAYPIRSILRKQKNVDVVLAEVTQIDLENRTVRSNVGDTRYDYLILAAGAATNYYAHPEWADRAIGLKDIDDAIEIRRRVLLAFEKAEIESDPEMRKQLMTFVVIGGGPTGVELAGSLAEMTRHTLSSDFRHITPASAKIILLEGFNRIFPPFTEDLSASATRQLGRLGVEVRTGVEVDSVDNRGVNLKAKKSADGQALEGERIPSYTVMWCAGVTPVSLTRTMATKLDRTNRILVEDDLSLADHPEAFAIGDIATYLHQTGGKPLPGLAPVAMQMGQAAARAIKATLSGKPREKFHYIDRGSLSTIGRAAGIAQFGKVKLSGLPAWLAWLFIHVFFLIGFRNRLVVMFDWIWSYMTYQRGSRLITGHRLEPGVPDKEDLETVPAQKN